MLYIPSPNLYPLQLWLINLFKMRASTFARTTFFLFFPLNNATHFYIITRSYIYLMCPTPGNVEDNLINIIYFIFISFSRQFLWVNHDNNYLDMWVVNCFEHPHPLDMYFINIYIIYVHSISCTYIYMRWFIPTWLIIIRNASTLRNFFFVNKKVFSFDSV